MPLPDHPAVPAPPTAAVDLPGPLVDAAWLRENLHRPGLVVLDATVRQKPLPTDAAAPSAPGAEAAGNTALPPTGRDGWERVRIPGSRYADLAGALASPEAGFSYAMPDSERFTAALRELGVGPDSRVVVYDDASRMWSTRVWWALREIGLHTVAVLDGGLQEWLAQGGPVVSGPAADLDAADPAAPAAGWPAEQRGTLVDTSEVLDVMNGSRPDRVLVCALGEDAFHGWAPTRYTRRGHIPTSLNLPAKDRLLDSRGRFLPRPELEEAVSALPADTGTLLYCGGGISATLLGFVLVLLGRDDVTVYDGSIEEWSADPSLPMTRTPPANS
ncbi:rhodanese-like domain-containing protein [Streptomyces sp. NBC_01635]|uniref:sulfurtransferase n=1 Tax=Streptomyces sp. NBC_01635 TaxID=2975904 RepID=UPI00386A31CB|nr:rhodanese-like domain-containing protein [Streptomyces sp. NBC_01635]